MTDTDNMQPKSPGRPPKDGIAKMVQTAVRLPVDLHAFYRSFENTSDAMRVALEAYRDGNYQKQNGEEV
jgi:hypothetical protein